ncbi:MAG: helix-turn-helix domain-containing protein [Nodosilinea sp.]
MIVLDVLLPTLSGKEYELLELFLRHPQRLLSRSIIIDHLWAMDDVPVEGSVTNLIKDLRQRLKAAGIVPNPIETVYGLGYRLKPAPKLDDTPLPITPASLLTKSEHLPLAFETKGLRHHSETWPEPQRMAKIFQLATDQFQGLRYSQIWCMAED